MEVFRICQEEYSKKLAASGTANRWNFGGQKVIYTGSSRSLATLELIVHRSAIIPTANYSVIVISIMDDENLIKQVSINDLPDNWRSLAAYSKLQDIGSKWYKGMETLLLKVPSAVIPYEYNYVINTEHRDYYKNVQLVRTEDYFWDNRLL